MKEAPPLKTGDKVGIAAPSGAFDKRAFEKGLAAIETMGLRPIYRKDIFSGHRYLAGSHRRRKDELQGLIDSPDIRAILFARGGFGLHHILPDLKLSKLRSYPKRIVGYSDLTMFLDRVREEEKIVTYYGPTVCDMGRSGPSVSRSMQRVLFGSMPGREWDLGKIQAIKGGTAEGLLAGGCLTLVCMSIGTPFEIDTGNKVLLIEDTNEEMYRIERMLLHLRQAGKFRGVRGVVISDLCATRCASWKEWTDMLSDIFADFKGPVVYGFRFGHCRNPHILPLGARVRLDTRKRVLKCVTR